MAKAIKDRAGKRLGLILNRKEASLLLSLLIRTQHKGISGKEDSPGRSDNAIFYALYENNIGALVDAELIEGVNRIPLSDKFVNAPEKE